jgi:amino acid adenylation domain-containing protein
MSFQTQKAKTKYAEDRCIQQLFGEQVERTPGAVALVFEDKQQLTYQELDRRANQLANYLRRQGVGPEVLVGICVERSPLMVIGLLGILKAGGAYVPLDPAYPRERLRFMLEDSAAPLFITQRALLASLPLRKGQTICLDDDWGSIGCESDEDPDSEAVAENLAYVIYTSGSTGKPKGVAIQHKSVVALLNWARGTFSPEELQGVLASTSVCFDLSVFELFVTLGLGGCVILADNALHLANLKSAQLVTLINTVPSAMAELLRMGGIPDTVRTVNLAGEPLKTSLVQQIHELRHVQRVFDLYGPSEDTTYSTFALRHSDGPATIGRPICNTEVYLLDSDLGLVPDGGAGEIYLGGQGLARGYLQRPDLTAEKFVPNPFNQDGSTRLYRTGDLARRLPDGNLEYLGRVDNQIKLRGFRIELAEIEMRLSEHPSIRDSVVAVKEDARGEKFLAGYFVADELPNVTALRNFLKNELPEYMIPSTFVRLDKMPLTANGKINRQALPEPSTDRPALQSEYLAPQGDIEVQLATVWEEVLGVNSLGTQDDFFELGGHSLIAVRLFAEIEKKFGRKLPLATLFEATTISQLATILQSGCAPSWSSLVPIQPKGSKPPIFCLHACGAHVFIYRALVSHLSPDQPVYGLQPPGLDGAEEPFNRVEDMAAHYVKEVRRLEPHGPYYLVGDTLGGLFAFEMAQQLNSQGEDVALLAMFDTFCPLPASFGVRSFSHVIHLKELGIKPYLLAAAKSGRRKLAKRLADSVADIPLTTEEEAYAENALADGDPIKRTEWGIYLATQVNYVPPARRYSGKITYFLARDNQYKSRLDDDRLRWKKLAGEFEVHVIPGRHDTMSDEPQVAVLAEKLTDCLSRAAKTPAALTAVAGAGISH